MHVRTAMSGAAKEHKRLTQQLELKRHALGLLQERIAGSESAQVSCFLLGGFYQSLSFQAPMNRYWPC